MSAASSPPRTSLAPAPGRRRSVASADGTLPNTSFSSTASSPRMEGPLSPGAGPVAATPLAASPSSTTLPASPSGSVTGGAESENVRVVCRVRPFNPREIELHNKAMESKPEYDRHPIRSVVEFQGTTCIFLDEEKGFIEKERFTFDSCLWSIPSSIQHSDNPFADQSALFEEHGKMLLQQAWKGYNTCFFAYGQTGSGKTFSMMGSEEDPGLIPRLCQQLFVDVERYTADAEAHKDTFVQHFKVEVRYLEVYNENVKDLLYTLSTLPPEIKAKTNFENCRVRSSPATGVFVENLTAVEVDSWKRLNELIALGNSCRTTAATKMNERSSRSHAVFKLTVQQITTNIPKKAFEKPTEHIRESCINLVDLAGSERNKKTGATGDRLKEASSINKSLHCLRFVIDVLVDNATTKETKKRPPYRDSTLTSLLMDSLGGNSKTFMLVCLSPHSDNADETLGTLKYGSRARQIVTVVKVNENVAGRMMVEMEEELERMRQEMERQSTTASVSDTVEALKTQIQEQEASMQRMEQAMADQQAKLQDLRDQQARTIRRATALALRNIQRLSSAKEDRQQSVEAYKKLKARVEDLSTKKHDLEVKTRDLEAEQERLRGEIESLQHQTAEDEQECEKVKKRNNRMEATKRELVANVEEHLASIDRSVKTRIGMILKTRLRCAKIRVDLKKQLAEQRQRNEAEIAAFRAEADRERNLLEADASAAEKGMQDSILATQAELDAVLAETAKVEQEKGAQVAALEEELGSLKAENRKKTESGTARLQQQQQDWDHKYATMVAQMETTHKETVESWTKRHEGEVAAMEAEFARRKQQREEQVASTREDWKKAIENARSEGAAQVAKKVAEWEADLEEKIRINAAMKEKLRAAEGRLREYAEMNRRIVTVMETAPAPTAPGASSEYQSLCEIISTFRTEFEANMPSQFKLANLLRDELVQRRCEVVPLVGGSDAPPTTLERLRPRSPRRA